MNDKIKSTPSSVFKPLSYPVTQNGVYLNPHSNKLEFWFVLEGLGAKVGECAMRFSKEFKANWEADVRRQIRQLLVKRFGAKIVTLASR